MDRSNAVSPRTSAFQKSSSGVAVETLPKGNDIVVGVTDSGLYMDHDQFDQPGPRQYDTINSTARKVVLYHTFVDKID
ncbi:unnamed protein product [Aphanomyces euteiches]